MKLVTSHVSYSAGGRIFTFFATMYCISHRSSDYRKAQRFYIVYGGILLAVAITDMAFNVLWGQYMWIDYRNHPGGPLGFYAASQHARYTVIGFGSDVMGNILGMRSSCVTSRPRGMTQIGD